MTILINNAESRPALVYDKLHILNFNLQIEKVPLNPKKKIDVVAIPYGLDVDGNRIFADNQIVISTKDFDADIMSYVISNGLNATVDEALTEYMNETATLSTELAAGNISVWHLMAEFEAAIGKVFDIEGVADFSTVE